MLPNVGLFFSSAVYIVSSHIIYKKGYRTHSEKPLSLIMAGEKKTLHMNYGAASFISLQ